MRNGADPGTRNFENELPCHLVPGGPVGDKVRACEQQQQQQQTTPHQKCVTFFENISTI